MEGVEYDSQNVGNAFVKHFKGIMGVKSAVEPLNDPDSLFINKLTASDALSMVSKVTSEEVKLAMFQISDEKAPGPDGFSAKFFKSAWDIVGTEVTAAVIEFFENGKLLKELNATVLSLILKVKAPKAVNEFRPIAYCNVLYKCISKVICKRLKGCLGNLVSCNQSTFVPGRLISGKILLSQELVKGYDWAMGHPGVALKIDLHKAYDSVSHSFLEDCLVHFGFHEKFIGWIMTWEKGFRQGDPMSPYLFILVMEVLNLILSRNINRYEKFVYHWRCGKLKLTHLCFADDLVIFCGADRGSIDVIKQALNEFSVVSGLIPNMGKSEIICGNVKEDLKAEILGALPFRVGEFPMKYLGVPLSSKKLFQKDCRLLIDKVKNRISDWRVKFLSYAGRVQLIKSVLSSLTVYWLSLLILPYNVSEDIERLIRGFLWNQGVGRRGIARVSWEDICYPKCQGGLGVASLKNQNIALMSKHIWNLVSNKDSIWVRWVKAYKLKGRSFWDTNETRFDSWSCGQLLQIRNKVMGNFVTKVGNGENVFAWYDNWMGKGMLVDLINRRDIKEAGFDFKTKLAYIYDGKVWKVPEEWHEKYPWLFVESRKFGKSVWHVIQKLVVVGTVYFIWQERNCCHFENNRRSVQQVSDLIMNSVRNRLLGLVWKNNSSVAEAAVEWNVELIKDRGISVVVWWLCFGWGKMCWLYDGKVESVGRDIVLGKDEDGMVADRRNREWWDAAGKGVLSLLVAAWRNEEGMAIWLAAGMKTMLCFCWIV
ncbi:putative RNA-directed DNA polymerase [Helianthus annuus]|nr:putative RNA-directed DNA polymerase [Helianthus annuus]KAJ0886057.1 putative RNA-directed DNA polymerase [Helianthus annuus]